MFVILYFALTWAVTSSFAQNGNTCSKSHDEQMLEKMVRLEYKMELMEKHVADAIGQQDSAIGDFNYSQTAERTVMMDEMQKWISLRTAITEQLLRNRKAMQSNTEELEKTKLELTEISEDVERMESTHTPLVAFNAYGLSARVLSANTGTIIKFKNVLLNQGLGYDNTTGIFTAPIGGLYLFTVHFCTQGTKGSVLKIVHNEIKSAVSTVSNLERNTCVSVNTFIMVRQGDRVNVASDYDNTVLSDDGHRRTSFLGYLLHV